MGAKQVAGGSSAFTISSLKFAVYLAPLFALFALTTLKLR